MNKLSIVILICVCLYAFLSCSKNEDQKPSEEIFEYDKYEQFKNWSISPREGYTYAFSNIVSDSIKNRFLINHEADSVLFLDVNSDKKEYVLYSRLSNKQKEILSEEMVLDYLNLGIEIMIYRIEDENEFLIITYKNDTYWYFFEFDDQDPPMLISNYKKMDSRWYKYLSAN